MLRKRLNFILDNGWKILIILTVSYQALVIPLDILFDLRVQHWYRVLDVLCSLVFFADLMENIKRYRRIKQNIYYRNIYWDTYSLKGLFVADALAVLPYALLFVHPALQLLRMFKWVKVFHMLYPYNIREAHSMYFIQRGSMSIVAYS